MDVDRRVMMTAVTLGGAAAATGAAPSPLDGRLLHHVFFWLRNPGSTPDRDRLVAGLRTLSAVPVVRGLHIGVPAPTEQRDVIDASYHVSELMLFDSVADQKIYQDHPLHQAFIRDCGPLWSRVVVYDTRPA